MPISLFPMDSLPVILDSVSSRQPNANERLSVAVLAGGLLSYDDSQLLDDAITV